MIFLSELQRRRVVDGQGRRLGRIADIVVKTGDLFPRVSAIIVDGPGGRKRIPWRQHAQLEANPIVIPDGGVAPTEPINESDEIRLARDVLDHQILDTKGRRVVKVNDLELSQLRGAMRLLGADVSVRGYLRRLGLEGAVNALRVPLQERLITWNNVESLDQAGVDLRLTDSASRIFKLHPADIAEVIEAIDVDEGAAMLRSLAPHLAASALSELDTDTQTELIGRLGPELAADLLEVMPADDAADILGDLPDEQAEQLLAGMQPQDAAEVRDLLRYDDESAGGIMSPEVIAIRDDLTVEDAIQRLRGLASSAEVAYYLFVVDERDRLVGVVSLRDLVTSAPETKLSAIMQTEVARVTVESDQEEAARVMSKYDLLALPVVDKGGRLTGVITADDIIDVIQEEADEDLSAVAGATVDDVEGISGVFEAAFGRLRWLAVTFVGGMLGALVLRAFAGADDLAATIVAFSPLLVLMAGQVAAQSLAVVTRGLGLGVGQELPWRESRIGMVLAVTLGVGTGLGAWVLTGQAGVGLAVGLSMAITTVIAVALGTLLPLLTDRLTARPRRFGQPLVGPVIGLISLLVYLGLAASLLGRMG